MTHRTSSNKYIKDGLLPKRIPHNRLLHKQTPQRNSAPVYMEIIELTPQLEKELIRRNFQRMINEIPINVDKIISLIQSGYKIKLAEIIYHNNKLHLKLFNNTHEDIAKQSIQFQNTELIMTMSKLLMYHVFDKHRTCLNNKGIQFKVNMALLHSLVQNGTILASLTGYPAQTRQLIK